VFHHRADRVPTLMRRVKVRRCTDEVRRRLASKGREMYSIKLRGRAPGACGEPANIPNEDRLQGSFESPGFSESPTPRARETLLLVIHGTKRNRLLGADAMMIEAEIPNEAASVVAELYREAVSRLSTKLTISEIPRMNPSTVFAEPAGRWRLPGHQSGLPVTPT
jgi:hypothetical protein